MEKRREQKLEGAELLEGLLEFERGLVQWLGAKREMDELKRMAFVKARL